MMRCLFYFYLYWKIFDVSGKVYFCFVFLSQRIDSFLFEREHCNDIWFSDLNCKCSNKGNNLVFVIYHIQGKLLIFVFIFESIEISNFRLYYEKICSTFLSTNVIGIYWRCLNSFCSCFDDLCIDLVEMWVIANLCLLIFIYWFAYRL